MGAFETNIIYKRDSNTLSLFMSNALGYMEIQIPASIEAIDVDEDFSLAVELSKLNHIFSSYSEQELKEMTIILGKNEDDTTYFNIKTERDILSLPHLAVNNLTEKYRAEDSFKEYNEDKGFCLSNIADTQDFIQGLLYTFSFIGRDDKKNNAIVINPSYVSYNDDRYIYKYNYTTGAITFDTQVFIYKKIARIIIDTFSSIEDFFVTNNNSIIHIKSPGFMAYLNNALSNASPPSEEDIEGLKPDVSLCTLPVNAVKDVTTFFSGFYNASMEYNPLTFTMDKLSTIKFILKDSGIAGQGSCNIERTLIVSDKEDTIEKVEYTIINDSLKQYLSKLMPTENIELKADDEKPAVYMTNGKTEIFFAKLVG